MIVGAGLLVFVRDVGFWRLQKRSICQQNEIMDSLEKKEYVAMNTAVDQSYRGRRLGAGRVMVLKSWFGHDHCDAP